MPAVMVHYLTDDLRAKGFEESRKGAGLYFQGIRQDSVKIKEKGLPMQESPRAASKGFI
jgi:hypothetical protein